MAPAIRKWLPLLLLIALVPKIQSARRGRTSRDREARFLPLFNRVMFKNELCRGTGDSADESGVCLSSSECSSKGGKKMGHCAAGFGTCCLLIEDECGGTIRENNTYVRNPEFPLYTQKTQSCSWEIARIHSNICFARLDFVRFEISAVNAADRSRCSIDWIDFTQGSGFFAPTLCGVNHGMHMYLEAGPEVDPRPMTLSLRLTGADIRRQWNIRVAQIPCGEPYTPYQGCRQFFTEMGGNFKSYNFEGGYHLNSMFYTVCIRRNKNMCRVLYRASDAALSFSLTNVIAGDMVAFNGGSSDCKSDYLLANFAAGPIGTTCITNAENVEGAAAIASPVPYTERFCGSSLSCIRETTSQRGQIITEAPFEFTVVTNPRETNQEVNNPGLDLDFLQLPC